MSDGKWSGQGASEVLIQPLSRHRILSVELGANYFVPPSSADDEVSSFYAAEAPNDFSVFSPGSVAQASGGPHFVMSPETPDNAKTLGLEWALFLGDLKSYTSSNTQSAYPDAGGFSVTIWCLIANSMQPDGYSTPLWAAMLPETGVEFDQLYHSFDINVHAIRFQITNASSPSRGANTGIIMIAMCEL